jgi:hypothetical protein
MICYGLIFPKKKIEELRNKKHELTEYGKQQLRKLLDGQKKGKDINN